MSFLTRGNLLKKLNQSLICLIPKGNQQETFGDFRPIGLCNVSYKFITKILVNRLQGILAEAISPFQNAFVKGRQISDNIILATEQLQYMRRCKSKKDFWVAIKIDF